MIFVLNLANLSRLARNLALRHEHPYSRFLNVFPKKYNCITWKRAESLEQTVDPFLYCEQIVLFDKWQSLHCCIVQTKNVFKSCFKGYFKKDHFACISSAQKKSSVSTFRNKDNSLHLVVEINT